MALEILKKLFDSPKNGDALDKAVEAVVNLERKRDAAKESLDGARASLESALADDLIADSDRNHDKLLQGLTLAEAKLAAAGRLLESARQEAQRVINDSSNRLRARLPELELEIATIKRGMDLRFLAEVANFCARMGLACHLPTATAPGGIQLPAVYGLTKEDLAQITSQTKPAPLKDPDQEKLDRLRAELNQAHIIVGSSSEIALLTIADAYRRRK